MISNNNGQMRTLPSDNQIQSATLIDVRVLWRMPGWRGGCKRAVDNQNRGDEAVRAKSAARAPPLA